MDPQILRAALRIGVLILGLALLMLPFQPRDSAEFVVTVLAALIGSFFVASVALLARALHSPLPRRAGEQRKAYNRRF